MSESQQNDGAVAERRKALGKLKRPELDAEAKGLGIPEPGELENVEAVIEAIIEREAEVQREADAAAKAEEQEKNPRYSRDEVLERAKALTGARRNIVFGALSGTDQETFTAAQAKRLVDDFLSKPDDTRAEDE